MGTVICLLSMLVKNSTASAIICLSYVLFSETLISVIKNISNFSYAAEKLLSGLIQHSLYVMSTLVSSVSLHQTT
jgi:hypothetical protein